MSRESSAVSDRLEMVASLLERLSDAGIRYVHWKSNEHLPAALRGETDLDLLIRDEDGSDFRRVVEDMGFVALEPVPGRRVAGMEGYLGFDSATGRLIHLDVHRRLVLGERLVKNHHLPIEEWLLDDARISDGVLIPRAEKELLLLYIRSMLKTTWKPLLRSILRGGSPFPDRIQREAAWLASQADRSSLPDTVRTSGLPFTPEEVEEFHERALAGRLGWPYVWRRRRSILRRMRRYQRQSQISAGLRKWWLRARSTPAAQRIGLGLPRRTISGRAPVVAVVGADGSGKTRLTRDLEAWLAQKLRVRHVYFGQPKGKGLFWLLNKPGAVVRSLGRSESAGRRALALVLSPIARWGERSKWLALAGRRRRLAVEARRHGGSGVVVIAERYPLRHFWSMEQPMDGPRLGQNSTRLLSRLEMRRYAAIPAPDLVIALQADLDTLRERKIDLTVDEHIAKTEAVSRLSPGEGLVVIDSTQPYEQMLLEAKRAVWDAILATR